VDGHRGQQKRWSRTNPLARQVPEFARFLVSNRIDGDDVANEFIRRAGYQVSSRCA